MFQTGSELKESESFAVGCVDFFDSSYVSNSHLSIRISLVNLLVREVVQSNNLLQNCMAGVWLREEQKHQQYIGCLATSVTIEFECTKTRRSVS